MDSLSKNHKEFIQNSKLILNSQQRFRSEKHSALTEKVNKIVMSPNRDKSIQSIDSVEIYKYRTRKDLVCKKQVIKCNNIIK